MSAVTRRVLYGLLAALGFALTVPFAVEVKRLGATLDPLDPNALTGAERLARLGLLFLFGFLWAGGFLYAALSAGYPRAWNPRRDGLERCARCAAEIGFGLRACPTCGQQFSR